MKTIHCINEMQRQQFGNYTTTWPATWYYTFHRMNELVGAVSASDTTLFVLRVASNGAKIVIEPGTANQEERTILSVTGSGPYTLTVAALSNDHDDGVDVATDPGFTADAVSEPSGGNYARAAHTNNSSNYGDATAAQSSNVTVITWPTLTADLAKMSHVLQFSASSGATCYEWWRLLSAIDLISGETPKINVGQLISLGRGVTA